MLVTLAEVKDYLGITDNSWDSYLNGEIAFISSIVNNYCGRVFEVTDHEEKFYMADYYTYKHLPLYHYPINSIASVKINDEEEITDFRFVSDIGILIRQESGVPISIFQGLDLSDYIIVRYNAGFVEIPEAIKYVCFSVIEERYNKKKHNINLNMGKEVQRFSIPGVMSLDFDYSLHASDRSVRFGTVLGMYASMLDPYRSERVINVDRSI